MPAACPPRPPLGPLLRSRLDLVGLVALGGAVGALARWGTETALQHGDDSIGWSTLLVNTTGSALLGALVVVLATRRPRSRRLRPLLGAGVLGGFTSFSTAALDLQHHLAGGRPGVALVTLALWLVLPAAAAWGGMALTRGTVARGTVTRGTVARGTVARGTDTGGDEART